MYAFAPARRSRLAVRNTSRRYAAKMLSRSGVAEVDALAARFEAAWEAFNMNRTAQTAQAAMAEFQAVAAEAQSMQSLAVEQVAAAQAQLTAAAAMADGLAEIISAAAMPEFQDELDDYLQDDTYDAYYD